MLYSYDLINLILIILSLLLVFLDTIMSKSNNYKISEVICYIFITILFSLNFINFITYGFNIKDDLNFINLCSSLFIFLNTFLFFKLIVINKLALDYSKIYMLIIAQLTSLQVFLSTNIYIIKSISIIVFIIIIITLIIKTTSGSKKAELVIKLSYTCIILFIIELFNIIFSSILNIENINLINNYTSVINVNIVFIFFILMSIFCLSGVAPFHDGHINTADASNPATAFLLYSNSCAIGLSILFKLKYQIFNTYYYDHKLLKNISIILLIGFLITSFRSIDQNKIKRTLAYIASCITPLVFLAALIGNSLSLPNRIYILGIYLFSTLSFFCLFGNLQTMKQINNNVATWEDIAGFGKNNILKTACLLIAIANIAGIPGTIGYFLKLSLLSYMQENFIFHLIIFLSIAISVASLMRIFVFFYAKNQNNLKNINDNSTSYLVIIASFILAALGLFPFIR